MRILVVSNQYLPVIGGIEVLLGQLTAALRSRGHEVAVLTGTHRTAPDPLYTVDGMAVHRNDIVRALARRDRLAVARCRQEARKVLADFAPEVIHAHDCGALLWALSGNGTPTLVTLQASLAMFDGGQLDPVARQLEQCSWVTGVSPDVAREVLELAPSLTGRVSVVVNGVTVPTTPPMPYPTARRIVAAGRMVPQKGFDVLLRAFALIAVTDPGAELVIIGDGHARPELEALASDLGVSGRVLMPGAVRHEQVPSVLGSAAVVAMPSRFEGLPLLALEAGLAERPVVGTPVQGLGDVVVDGETGLHVPPEDPDALAAALMALLDDPERAARLGRAARRRVVADYSLDATVTAYEALYQTLHGGTR